jgi:hypothetical protein
MTFQRALVFAFLLLTGVPQGEERFKGRLSPVPIDATTRASVTGLGNFTATLNGNRLAINGTFEGLGGPATIARLHQSVATGVRGAAITELMVSKAVRGTLSGTVTLTPEQTDSLKKGRLYIQIHSEKAPDGNLWGWLLR